MDYLAFLDKLAENAVVLFHDSVRQKVSPIYGKDNLYTHTVCLFMERLRRTPGLELFCLPFDDGVTLVQGRPLTLDIIKQPFDEASFSKLLATDSNCLTEMALNSSLQLGWQSAHSRYLRTICTRYLHVA